MNQLHASRVLWTLSLVLITFSVTGRTIDVEAVKDDATPVLNRVLEEIAEESSPVIIKLNPSEYHLYRKTSVNKLYHISNTASEKENPDQTKHIGLFFKNLKNVTLDGNGAKLITHGELTSFVIDSCENIAIKNLTITAADPSVPEIRIVEVDSLSFIGEVISPSKFEISDRCFRFLGEGWTLPDDGSHAGAQFITQVFNPETNVTLRVPNPIQNYTEADKIGDRTVLFRFKSTPKVKTGEFYQFRHSVRNEACGFINRSKDVTLENVDFQFMGNFGVVSQFSENLNFHHIVCAPDSTSQRTAAGFADFLQFSSCKGLISVKDSRFEGSHDDPINIHGTHLQVSRFLNPMAVEIQYMHPQTFGFTPFFENDSVEFVDKRTLLKRHVSKVLKCERIDNYSYEITFDAPLETQEIENLVVENITWTPAVEISGNRFARTPTRAILLTTRRHSEIKDNYFYRIPMAAILVSDDARSWYESGPVHDLTISGNTFFECSSPAILIKPEVDHYEGAVHSGIIIEDNIFVNQKEPAITVSPEDSVTIKSNIYKIDD